MRFARLTRGRGDHTKTREPPIYVSYFSQRVQGHRFYIGHLPATTVRQPSKRANEPMLAGDDDSFEDPKTIHLTFRNLIENRNSPRIE